MMKDAARRRMLREILKVVGVGGSSAAMLVGACGGQVDGGRTGEPGEPPPTAGTTTGNPGTTPPSPPTTPPKPAACPSPLTTVITAARCATEAGRGEVVCLPRPRKGTCDSAYSEKCILEGYRCGLIMRGNSVECLLPVDEACCWQVQGDCAVGRPLLVDGKAIVAPLTESGGWTLSEAMSSIELFASTLDTRTRAAIADVWARDGLSEHASVASFARFMVELLAAGGPMEMVTATQKAIGEEIAHAQRCFTLASIYAAAPRGPGRLPVENALPASIDLADFAARTAAEGCIAETIAALQLHAAADAAREPALRALLRATAEEEADHALLAWSAVRWAIANGGDRVRGAVREVFARSSAHVGFGPCPTETIDADVLRDHGVLSRRERHDLALAALASVVRPAAEELLAPLGTARPAAQTLQA